MAKKNILILFYANPDFYPSVINIIALLSDKYQVTVLCRNIKQSGVKYPDGAKVLRLGKKIDSDQQAANQSALRKLIQFSAFVVRAVIESLFSRPGIIISYDMHGLSAGLIAKAANPHSRFIYQCHDLVELIHCSAFMKWVKRIELRYARLCDLVVFPNAKRAQLFQEEAGLLRTPLIVANANLLRPRVENGLLRAYLQSKGLPADEPIVLHQGIICRNQQALNVLKSVPLWHRGLCVMIGAFEEGLRNEVERLIEDLGIAKRVIFIRHVPYDQLFRYTADAAIGLALTKPSNINLEYYAEAACKINDYMACGVPVITSNNNDCSQVYGEAKWIAYVDVDSEESIASAVNGWLDNPEGLRLAGAEARKLHLERYNYEKCSEQMRRFIEEAMSR